MPPAGDWQGGPGEAAAVQAEILPILMVGWQEEHAALVAAEVAVGIPLAVAEAGNLPRQGMEQAVALGQG